jgi:hypothetical protein
MRSISRALDHPTRQLLRTWAAGAAADATFAQTVRDQFLARRREALMTILDQGGAVRRTDPPLLPAPMSTS